MAELTISSDEIRGALEHYVSSYTPELSREEVGTVADAGDGIAHVEGLPSAMANELLEFEDGTLGVALNLDVRDIGVVVLGDYSGIEEGQRVKRTGRVLSVPVGDKFLGRVVSALGEPIDEPVYGAMYLKPAGSEAGDATIVVYSIAPCSSSTPLIEAMVEAFCPIAT